MRRQGLLWLVLWLAVVGAVAGWVASAHATVTSTVARNDYTGNGATTVFPYTFRILAAGDIRVTVNGIAKALTSDYTVSSVGASTGGNVTLLAAPPNGQAVVITRNVPLTQTTDYVENSVFSAEGLERNLDKLTMMIQQVNERVADPNLDGGPTLGTGAAGLMTYWTGATTVAGSSTMVRNSSGLLDINFGAPAYATLSHGGIRTRVRNDTGAGLPQTAANFQMYSGNCGEFNSTPIGTDVGGTQVSVIRCAGNDGLAVLGLDVYAYIPSYSVFADNGPVNAFVAQVLKDASVPDGGATCIHATGCYPVTTAIVAGANGLVNVGYGLDKATVGSRFWHGMVFQPLTIMPYNQGGSGIWFAGSHDGEFIRMQPSDDEDHVAVRITTANLNTDRLQLTKRGSFLSGAATTSATLPSFTWIEDPDTGMYRNADNAIGFTTAGSVKLVISDTSITSALTIAPSGDNTLAIGSSSLRWASVNAARYDSGANTGISTAATVRDGGGVADCTLTFTGGVLTGSTC